MKTAPGPLAKADLLLGCTKEKKADGIEWDYTEQSFYIFAVKSSCEGCGYSTAVLLQAVTYYQKIAWLYLVSVSINKIHHTVSVCIVKFSDFFTFLSSNDKIESNTQKSFQQYTIKQYDKVLQMQKCFILH